MAVQVKAVSTGHDQEVVGPKSAAAAIRQPIGLMKKIVPLLEPPTIERKLYSRLYLIVSKVLCDPLR